MSKGLLGFMNRLRSSNTALLILRSLWASLSSTSQEAEDELQNTGESTFLKNGWEATQAVRVFSIRFLVSRHVSRSKHLRQNFNFIKVSLYFASYELELKRVTCRM